MPGLQYQVDPKQLSYIKNLLEGYDNLGLMTTLDQQQGTFEIKSPASMLRETERVAEAVIQILREKEV